MILVVKKLLFRILGLELYLKLLHKSFFIAYNLGILKSNPIYKYHYFVKNLIQSGDTVLDIGANLGYYTKNFSNLVGAKGHVYSIEPVKLFFDTLTWAMKGRTNCTLYNNALGTETKKIELILPRHGGLFRSGLAHIPQDETPSKDDYVFETNMVRGSELLAHLERLDYIKCDIEGYEAIVLPEIKSLIERCKPIVQVETGGEQKKVLDKLFAELGYKEFTIDQNKLKAILKPEDVSGDNLYIHQSQVEDVVSSLKSKGLV